MSMKTGDGLGMLLVGMLVIGVAFLIKFSILMYVWNNCLIDLFGFVKQPMTWTHVFYLALFMMFWRVEPGSSE